MKELIILLDLFSAINAAAIVWLLFKSNDGWLRRLLLFFFSCLTFELCLRACSWIFGWPTDLVALIVMCPVSVAMLALTMYLYKNFKKK